MTDSLMPSDERAPLLDTSLHDRRLRRMKRNPIFWLLFQWHYFWARRTGR